MNFLMTSVGRRVSLMQYFKKELNAIGAKVIAIDSDSMASALYFADHYEIVPLITSPDYIDVLLGLCQKYDIQGIVTLIDPELSILTKHKQLFLSHGVTLVVSDPEVIEICFDKKQTYDYLTSFGISAVPTYSGFEEVETALKDGNLTFPMFAKPRRGSSSMGIQILYSEIDLNYRLGLGADDIFQPLMQGKEYCTDAYVDMVSEKPVSIFGIRVLEVLPIKGPVDMDFFKTKAGYVISEINPRFGGGYPHAYEAGQNFIQYLIKNLQGEPHESEIGQYQQGIVMMKYDQVLIRLESETAAGIELLSHV
jgi:carbamoyl-phosphate synthase large subunit